MKKLLLTCTMLFVGAMAFAQEKQAEIKFEETTSSFGTITEGKLGEVEFEFKNTGNAPLVLTSVNASCGCTTPEWPKEPIMPGQTAKITGVYNSTGRGTGQISKSITVVSNAKTGTVILTLTGNVVANSSPAPEKPAP